MHPIKKFAASVPALLLLLPLVAQAQVGPATQSAPKAPGILLNTFRGHTGNIQSVAISPDSKTVATGAADRTLRLWNTEDGTQRASLPLPGSGLGVCFSADGTRLAVGSARQVVVVDPIAAKVLTTLDAPGVISQVALSADGKRVEASGISGAAVWDLPTQKELLTVKNHVPRGGFSPDGATLAVVDSRGTINLWSVADNKAIATVHENGGLVDAAAFSPDSKIFAAANSAGRMANNGEDTSIYLWDSATGRQRSALIGHVKGVYALTFSSDGKRLWAADYNGSQKLWDVEHGTVLSRLEQVKVDGNLRGTPIGQWAISPDFRYWVSGSELDVLWYDVRDFTRPGSTR